MDGLNALCQKVIDEKFTIAKERAELKEQLRVAVEALEKFYSSINGEKYLIDVVYPALEKIAELEQIKGK